MLHSLCDESEGPIFSCDFVMEQGMGEGGGVALQLDLYLTLGIIRDLLHERLSRSVNVIALFD